MTTRKYSCGSGGIRNISSHNEVLYDFNQPVNIGKIPHQRYCVKTRDNNNLNTSMKLILFILSKISVNRAEEMKQKLIQLFEDLDFSEEVQNSIKDKINFDTA